jgi:hypothetical protein
MMPMFRLSKGKKPSRYTAIPTLGCIKKEGLTMKQTTVLTGVLAAMLMFGSTLAGWSLDGDEDSGGIFTLTDIPAEYHGMYIMLTAGNEDGLTIGGATEIDTEILDIFFVAIVGDRVDIPLWSVTDEGNHFNTDRYTGNDTLDVRIDINSKERGSDHENTVIYFMLEAVTFANGSTTASWKDCTPLD